MQYPKFDRTEYGCLSKDLYVVKFYHKLQKVLTTIELANTKKAVLQQQEGTKGQKLFTDIQDLLADARRELDPSTRKARLKSSIENYITDKRKTNRHYGITAKLKSHIESVLDTYQQFDDVAFETDFNKLFEHELSKPDDKKEVAKLNGQIGKATADEKKLWKTEWKKCFKDGEIPRKFRDWRVTEKFTELDMGKLIIKMFLADWSNRATEFSEEVTVTGTAIYSLPDPFRKTWNEAYESLKLGARKKRVIYYAHKSTERSEQEASLPEFFNTPTELIDSEN